jgi:hypothetical protein
MQKAAAILKKSCVSLEASPEVVQQRCTGCHAVSLGPAHTKHRSPA